MPAAETQKLSRHTVYTNDSLQEEAEFNKFWDHTLSEETMSQVDNPELPPKLHPTKNWRMFQWQCKPWVSFRYSEPLSANILWSIRFCNKRYSKRFERPDYQINVNLENLLLKAYSGTYWGTRSCNRILRHWFWRTTLKSSFRNVCRRLSKSNQEAFTVYNRTLTRFFRNSEKFNKQSHLAGKYCSCTFRNKCY